MYRSLLNIVIMYFLIDQFTPINPNHFMMFAGVIVLIGILFSHRKQPK